MLVYKWFKNALKIIGLIGFLFLILSFVLYPIVMTSRPEGVKGEEADKLAKKMLKALNSEAWDNTRLVSWDFPGGHHYLWDKNRSLVHVCWKKNEVFLQINQRDKSVVLKNGEVLSQGSEELIEKAWKYYCNDSFWLTAPYKVFDEGTSRSIVKDKNGEQQLLITYDSGGVTPGDAYLWKLNGEGIPVSFKMWVSIIPIGGLKASWEGWEDFSTGVSFSTKHKLLFLINIKLKNIKTGNSFEDIGLKTDPFNGHL